MVAEVTSVQNKSTFLVKIQKFDISFVDFAEKLHTKKKELEYINISTTSEETTKTNGTTSSTETTEVPPKSRVEQTKDLLRQMLQDSISKSNPNLTSDAIGKMNLEELQITAKSIMKDATDFINLANLIPIIETIPEDCGACFTSDKNGKCISYKIFRPDGTVIDGDISKVKDFFIDQDLDEIIKQMSLEQLKKFCLKGSNPIDAFKSILKDLSENSTIKQEDLNNKLKTSNDNIKEYENILKNKATTENDKESVLCINSEKISFLGIQLTQIR